MSNSMIATVLPNVNREISATQRIEEKHDPADGLKFVLDVLGCSTIVAIHPDQPTIVARWLDVKSLADVTGWATERNNAGHNLYFAVNTPITGLAKKPAKAQITALRAIFADVDAKEGRSLTEALAAIAALPTPPSVIIASGGGFQPIWMLDAPVPATSEKVAAAEAVGRQIALLAGGDMVQNVDRILRLPFTKNYPDARKRAAGRVVSCSGLVREEAGR